MAALTVSLLGALRSAFRTRADLSLENLALRQQLANLQQRTSGRPRLRNSDRAFWLVLSRFWSRWADVLVVVKPDIVVRWHRAGFRLFWRWKSRSGSSSDRGVSQEIKRLIDVNYFCRPTTTILAGAARGGCRPRRPREG